MKILLVDDQTILLNGIASLLARSAYEVAEQANTVDEALNYFEEKEFDILITDFNIVDDNGLVLIRKVKQIYPHLKIIVLSMQDEAHLIQEILKEGINGHVLNRESHHELVNELSNVNEGEVFLSDEMNQVIHDALTRKNEDLKLSEKESTVLSLIANNYSKVEIGKELSLSDRSVNTLCRSLFKKTKTSSIVSLLKFAYANNLV